ncbi:MAG: YceI family protein [Pyrinomonadaceae bacterium]|nr:YceI family protein [Pyrinomonadaceae bacterium]
MKKLILSLGIFVFASAFVFFGSTTNATNLNFVESFYANASDTKLKPEETTGTYSLDKAHSSIGFRVRHMGLVDVPGYFRDFSGTIKYDGKDVSKSSVEFSAKMESVDTGVAGRDKHLKTADFFEVEKYPEMTFKSTKVEKKGKNWIVTGDLTMKGVTKSLSIPFTVVDIIKDQRGGTKMGVMAETVINRRDFGVNYGSNMPNGVAMLSDNITVVLNLESNMQKAQ